MAPRQPVDGRFDPSRSLFITLVGKKRSGKSVLATHLFESYPYDRIVIDPTGDVKLTNAEELKRTGELVELHGVDLPRRFPTRWDEGKRTTVHYIPDPGSATYEDDLDRAVGLAFNHPDKRCCLWIDEVGELTRANKTPPYFRRALHQGRHRGLSMIMCGPRTVDINPLVLSQADLVYCFRLPGVHDRKRLADTIGWDEAELNDAIMSLPEHGYLQYDSTASDEEGPLTEYPPLPLHRRPT